MGKYEVITHAGTVELSDKMCVLANLTGSRFPDTNKTKKISPRRFQSRKLQRNWN